MKISLILKSTFQICIVILLFKQSNNSPVFGKYAGKTINALNTTLYAFFGIPYAVPPIGELRFREPQPFQYNSDIIYNATRKSPSCMQDPPFPLAEWFDRYPRDVSEDCLYLNIWVPSSKPDGKPLATMVWIHGGIFYMQSSNMKIYDGAVIAALGNVIVVTLNYRLAALGFANFGEEDARGNMGMLDQVLALKWVHQNIEDFGGDSNLITVFGQSAGAVSIAHHLISPMTKGLFQRAILQSGSNYLEYFAVNATFNRKNTEIHSEELGCDATDMLNCMKRKDAYEIVAAEKQLIKRKRILIYYHPQIGPPFLSENPFYDVDVGKFHDVDVLIGGVKDEGSLFVVVLKPEIAIDNAPIVTKADAKFIMSKAYKLTGEYLDRIVKEYLEKVSDNDYSEILKQTSRAIGNGAFTCPTSHLVERLTQFDRKVYFYEFNHTRFNSLYKKWVGVPHFEDVYFVFGRPLIKKKGYTKEEVDFSKRIIQLWTSYAKTGKPTYDGMEGEWKPFENRERNALSLTLGNIHLKKAEVEEKCEFWKDFLREYTSQLYMH